jgi:hypothetical protein
VLQEILQALRRARSVARTVFLRPDGLSCHALPPSLHRLLPGGEATQRCNGVVEVCNDRCSKGCNDFAVTGVPAVCMLHSGSTTLAEREAHLSTNMERTAHQSTYVHASCIAGITQDILEAMYLSYQHMLSICAQLVQRSCAGTLRDLNVANELATLDDQASTDQAQLEPHHAALEQQIRSLRCRVMREKVAATRVRIASGCHLHVADEAVQHGADMARACLAAVRAWLTHLCASLCCNTRSALVQERIDRLQRRHENLEAHVSSCTQQDATTTQAMELLVALLEQRPGDVAAPGGMAAEVHATAHDGGVGQPSTKADAFTPELMATKESPAMHSILGAAELP